MNHTAAYALVKAGLPRVLRAVRKDLREDRANAYGLSEPWTLPKLGGDLPGLGLMPTEGFRDERFLIAGPNVTVLPFPCRAEECDGCTLSPDTWWELKTWVGALFHDRWYLSMEAIAAAWGWPVAKARKLGDAIFASILEALAEGLPFWSRLRAKAAVRLYYRGVRCFGGVAHGSFKRFAGAKILAAVAGCLLLSGCGGCAAPQAFDDPAALQMPQGVSFTNTVTGAHW